MHINVGGKRFRVCLKSQMFLDGVPIDGLCDAPDATDKQITVRAGLRDRRLLEVFIHEFLHAAFWHLSEECVEQTARELSEFLWRLGYRLPADWRERNNL